MKVADAHCDTLTKFAGNPFNTADAHWNLDKFSKVSGILQYFAIYTPPELAGDSALRFAFTSVGNFIGKKNDNIVHLKSKDDYDESKVNILLSLEGASPIINDINNLYAFYALGVRAMGLTWNHRNFVGDGIDTDYGLTPFGREVIKEMEKLKMIIDVSHLNTAGFDDVAKEVKCPFIASHSNAGAVYEHRRNLHDEQIKEIISRKGFMGMNFYSEFIEDAASINQKSILKHIEHVLNLGGGDILGLGADFDGIDSSPFKDAADYDIIKEMLAHDLKLGNQAIEKIMYKNLLDFTLNNL